MDQTPLAFEFLSTGRTYDHRGNNTVLLKGGASGWEKRQATLQICVFADSQPHYKPLLIFAGKPGPGNKNRQSEMRKYHYRVDVIYNKKAYCDIEVLISWLKNQYRWATPWSPSDNDPRLLVLDAFAPHKAQGRKKAKNKTDSQRTKRENEEQKVQRLRQILKDLNTTTSIIPGGCTGYVQVLDVSVNKIIKDLIKQFEEDHYDANPEEWKAGSYSKGDRRVLLTQWVGKAWETLHSKYTETIIKTFRQVQIFQFYFRNISIGFIHRALLTCILTARSLPQPRRL